MSLSLAFDDEWNLYTYLLHGVAKYDGQNWSLVYGENMISNPAKHGISAIEIDAHGNIGLGTSTIVLSDIDYGEGLINLMARTLPDTLLTIPVVLIHEL